MNGYKILEDSARLAGFCELDDNLKIMGLVLINEIIQDLGYLPLSSLTESVGISYEKALSALRFGLAALILGTAGDLDGRNEMWAVYTKKKSQIKNRIVRVKNIMPGGEQ